MEDYAGPQALETPRVRAATSKYEAAYRTGFRSLRFPESIEKEYLRVNAPVIRRRLGNAGIIGIIAIGVWFLLDLLTVRYFQFPAAWLTLGAWMTPLMGLLILFNRPKNRKQPVNEWLLLIVDILLGFGFVSLQLIMQLRHLPGSSYPYVALIVMLSTIYVSGLMTWRATLAGAVILLGYGFGNALLIPHAILPLSHTLFFLVLVIVIGTSASWRLEHADREHFLLIRMLAEMAEHDSLTGLLNHAAFMRHGSRAWRQAVREKKPIGLLIADIDHFKGFNDHYGHPAGDICIYRIAATLADAAKRGLDSVARIGGEEFAVFWYDLPPELVAIKAEKIRAAIHRLEIPHAASDPGSHVTVSIGIYSLVPSETQDFKSAIQHADKALYAAKRSGRDKICKV